MERLDGLEHIAGDGRLGVRRWEGASVATGVEVYDRFCHQDLPHGDFFFTFRAATQ